MKPTLLLLFSALIVNACAQTPKNDKHQTAVETSKTDNTMDISKITNPQVKQAIEALQASDKQAWYAYFTSDAVFTDDGRTLEFKSFFDNAFNHKEKFLSIEKVENDGKDVYGNFYAGQWGTFKVYFKFHQQADGKFNRIDIGQAK